jgi:hypothetical protein
MTGITAEMLEGGEPEERVWAALRDAQRSAAGTLAHYAQFERRFFEEVASRWDDEARNATQGRWICTHRIAKNLLPGLPSRGLRAMAGFFGRPVAEANRAGSHVEATAWVWRHLVRELGETVGVETAGDLHDWMSEEGDGAQAQSRGGTYALARDRRLALPDEPGVYRMIDGEGGTLYIGKATSVRDRVNQYFQTRRGLSGRKKELVSQVHDVRCSLEATPLEAAIAESDAIKESEPPYNEALVSDGRQTVPVGRWPGGDEAVSLLGVEPESIWLTVGQRGVLDRLAALEESLATGEPTEELVEAVRRESLGAEDELGDEFERFRARVLAEMGAGRVGYEQWMACGARWRRQKRRRDESESTSDAGGSEEDRTYEDEFESLVRHGTAALARGIWLYRLSGAAVAWRPRAWEGGEADGWRFVAVSNGEIEQRRTVPGEEADRRIAAWEGQCGELETIRMYDRMRVMATKLKRLVGGGAEIRVGCSRWWMDGEALCRLVTGV